MYFPVQFHKLLDRRLNRERIHMQGFTLIELLVVIVILGVLGGVGYGAYLNQVERANENTARVAAVAAAKSCAALLTTGDEDSFVPGVDGTRVQISPITCAADQTFTATAGEGANAQTASAVIDENGAVIPNP